MAFNYSKLNGRIIEKYGTRKNFAGVFGITEANLSMKLHNKSAWSQADIVKALKLLSISEADIESYFFTQ